LKLEEIMRFSPAKGVLLAAAICVGGMAGMPNAALAQDAAAEAKTAGAGAPDAFLKAYFVAMSKAKGPKDVEPYVADEVKAKMGPAPDEAELGPLFAEMIHSTHPVEVKIESKKEEGDRVIYDLTPTKLPKAVEDMAKDATFSMTGNAILVKQNGLWKVYKDFWIAESKSKDGNMRMTFGTDPDKKDDDKASFGSGPGGKPDYSDSLRDIFMEKFKQAGSAKAIYITMKIAADGTVTDVNVAGEKAQKAAEDQVRAFISQAQPLPAPPSDMAGKPYAWMILDWQEDGGKCINGPFFDEKTPNWVNEKMGQKTDASAVQ
jgi:hypothetical protein